MAARVPEHMFGRAVHNHVVSVYKQWGVIRLTRTEGSCPRRSTHPTTARRTRSKTGLLSLRRIPQVLHIWCVVRVCENVKVSVIPRTVAKAFQFVSCALVNVNVIVRRMSCELTNAQVGVKLEQCSQPRRCLETAVEGCVYTGNVHTHVAV